MMYATYEFYRDQYCGTMSETDFPRLAVRVSGYLDQVTRDRIPAGWETGRHADRIRMACCAVADAWLLNEQGGGVVSESNDGISITYAKAAKDDQLRLYDAAMMYLGRTGLMSLGV